MCRDSSVGIATGYGLDCPAIESRWETIFSTLVQTYREVHPVSCTSGTGSLPGCKAAGPWRWPPSSAEVKERVELYLYSTSGPSWAALGWTYLTTEWLVHSEYQVCYPGVKRHGYSVRGSTYIEGVEPNLCLPSGSTLCVSGWTLPLLYMFSIGLIISCPYACINVYSQGTSYELTFWHRRSTFKF